MSNVRKTTPPIEWRMSKLYAKMFGYTHLINIASGRLGMFRLGGISTYINFLMLGNFAKSLLLIITGGGITIGRNLHHRRRNGNALLVNSILYSALTVISTNVKLPMFRNYIQISDMYQKDALSFTGPDVQFGTGRGIPNFYPTQYKSTTGFFSFLAPRKEVSSKENSGGVGVMGQN